MYQCHKKQIRKRFCIFFVGLFALMTSALSIYAAVGAPPSFIEKSDGGHTTSNGAHTEFIYQAALKQYDRRSETALYEIGQYFTVENNSAKILSDRVYLTNRLFNRKFIGEYSAYNGWQAPGVYQRGVWFEATLVSGANVLIMEGQGGDAGTGDALLRIVVPRFGHDPQVHGVNGVWTQGDITRGIRTWQSLYTDGATGSSEGNKKATSTGFFSVTQTNKFSRFLLIKTCRSVKMPQSVKWRSNRQTDHGKRYTGVKWIIPVCIEFNVARKIRPGTALALIAT